MLAVEVMGKRGRKRKSETEPTTQAAAPLPPTKSVAEGSLHPPCDSAARSDRGEGWR